MLIAIPFDPNRLENERKTYANAIGCQPCILCGRKIINPKHMVHVHDGGVTIVTEDEAKNMDESADMGLFAIGADCLKAHPEIKPYVSK